MLTFPLLLAGSLDFGPAPPPSTEIAGVNVIIQVHTYEVHGHTPNAIAQSLYADAKCVDSYPGLMCVYHGLPGTNVFSRRFSTGCLNPHIPADLAIDVSLPRWNRPHVPGLRAVLLWREFSEYAEGYAQAHVDAVVQTAVRWREEILARDGVGA